MKRLALLILVLGVLAAACGDDDGGVFTTTTEAASTTAETSTTGGTTGATTSAPTTSAPTTSTASTSSTSSTTSSTTSTTTTTTAPEVIYEVNTSNFFPPVFPSSNGGHGSGCVTPGFAELPNGVWFGFAEAVAGGHITFDLACFWTGTEACDAQIADGFASAPDECLDYYVQNNVATTFDVRLASGARAWYVDMVASDVTSPTEIPLASWPTADSFQTCPGNHCAVWLYVNHGRATAVVEQYLP